MGIILQYSIDSALHNDGWNNLSFEEKRTVAHSMVEKAKQDMRDQGINIDDEIKKICDEFNKKHQISVETALCKKLDNIFFKLKANGGARLVNNIKSDEAGVFLLDVCEQMAHAPLPHTLVNICSISIENLNGELAIVYSFRYTPNSICQNVFIFLVHTQNTEIRLFAVETHLSSFMLCEYSGHSHLNYGPVELKNVPARIKEILEDNDD